MSSVGLSTLLALVLCAMVLVAIVIAVGLWYSQRGRG